MNQHQFRCPENAGQPRDVMQPVSRQDLIKPHLAELRQQAQQAHMAQATRQARQARQPQTRQHRHKTRHPPAPALARRVRAPIRTSSCRSQSMTVVLTVEATKSLDGKAGFKVPVVELELGGGGSRQRSSGQTVTVVFGEPVDRDGRPVKVARASDKPKG